MFIREKAYGYSAGGATTVSFVVPESVKVGDVAVIFVSYTNTVSVSTATSLVAGASSTLDASGVKTSSYYGVADAAELNTTQTITLTGASTGDIVCEVVFLGGCGTAPIVRVNGSATSGTSSASANILTKKGIDAFNSAGVTVNLAGQTASDTGGNWASKGSAPGVDFQKIYGGLNGSAARWSSGTDGAGLDANLRISYLNNSDSTEIDLSCPISGTVASDGDNYAGLCLRYVDDNNWSALVFKNNRATSNAWPSNHVVLVKKKAGVQTSSNLTLTTALAFTPANDATFQSYSGSMRVTITTAGVLTLYTAETPGAAWVQNYQVTDSDYATAGALDNGHIGIAHKNESTGAGYLFRWGATNYPFQGRTILDTTTKGAIAYGVCLDANSGFFSSTDGKGFTTINSNLSRQSGDTSGRGTTIAALLSNTSSNYPATLSYTDNRESGTNAEKHIFVATFANAAAPSLPTRTTPPAAGRKKWQLFIKPTYSFPGTYVAEIKDFSGLNLTKVLNGAGSISFKCNTASEYYAYLNPMQYSIVAVRDGEVKLAGPIWNIGQDFPSGDVNVSCQGYLQIFDKRMVAPSNEESSGMNNWDAGAIAGQLLYFANSRENTNLYLGAVESTQDRTRKYQRYANILQEIFALSQIESGYDIWMDYNTGEIKLYSRLARDYSSEIVFGVGPGVNNVTSFSTQTTADKLVNGIYALTKTTSSTPAQQINQTSIDTYGLIEEQQSLGDVDDPNIALAYAAGEFVYRSQPLPIISFTPVPSTGDTPRPFEHYDVGDIVKFAAEKDGFSYNNNVRIFSINITVDDNGVERVGTIQSIKE